MTNIRYKYLVLGRGKFYFVKHSDSTKKFSETDIIKMFEFLIDNIFIMFGRCVTFLCVPTVLLFVLACFIQGILNKNENNLALFFNFTFRYMQNDFFTLAAITW